MKVNPYLNFPGTCREALEFYADVLDGEITAMMTAAGTPAEADVDPALIIHACLVVDGFKIMASDAPASMYVEPQGTYVLLGVDGVEEAERIYAAFEEGAKSIEMPIQETFWAHRFAMITDRYGTPWMISHDKPYE